MKKIYTVSFLMAMMLSIISCSEDDKPTKEEAFLADLSGGAWQVDAVALDNEDVTGEFDGMTITFKKDQTFTIQNGVGNIWDNTGTFTLEEGTAGNFNLMRDDDTLVSISALNGNSLVFAMQFDSAPGRIKGLAGQYVFEMKR